MDSKDSFTLPRRCEPSNELALVTPQTLGVRKKWHSMPQYLQILKEIDATPGAAGRSDSRAARSSQGPLYDYDYYYWPPLSAPLFKNVRVCVCV